MVKPSCRTCEYLIKIDGELICVDSNQVTLDYYCNDYSVNCELCTYVDRDMCSLKGIPYIKRHEDTCKDFKESKTMAKINKTINDKCGEHCFLYHGSGHIQSCKTVCDKEVTCKDVITSKECNWCDIPFMILDDIKCKCVADLMVVSR